MLEDRAQNVVYLPIARELFGSLSGWSAPLQVRLLKPRGSAEPELVVRMLDEPVSERRVLEAVRVGQIGVCPSCVEPLAFLEGNRAFCRGGHTFKVHPPRFLIHAHADKAPSSYWTDTTLEPIEAW